MEFDHVFRSRWLLDHLARLGFSVTSDEFKLYSQFCRRSAIYLTCQIIQIAFLLSGVLTMSITTQQPWMKKKTFHGIGVIVSVTPKNTDIRSQAIKRFQKKQLVDNIVKSKGISIYLF